MIDKPDGLGVTVGIGNLGEVLGVSLRLGKENIVMSLKYAELLTLQIQTIVTAIKEKKQDER